MPETAPPPTSNFAEYRACAAEAAALPPERWRFKADPRYRRILEHVPPAHGEAFLERAAEAAEEDWPALSQKVPALVEEADALGCPETSWCSGLGLACSPANLRYLCHALLVLRHAEGLGLARVAVVELGGGYGGLAHYLARLSPLLGVTVASHTIVDLPEAGALQRAYCRALGVPVRTVDGLDGNALAAMVRATARARESGYFVSAYAFSEFDADTRAWYAPLARACAHGFVVWNFPTPLFDVAEKPLGGPVYAFVDAPLTVAPERPCTGPGNLEVTF